MEKVVFADDFNVAEIPSGAFAEFVALKEIEIPDCVKSIGEDAFADCGGLTSISLPEGLQSIGARAFYECTFTSVTLPASLKRIGDEAFSNEGISGWDYGVRLVKVLSDGTPDNKHYILLGDSDSESATGESVFPNFVW